MNRHVKSQAATEYIVMAAVALLVVIPAAFLFYSHASRTSAEIDHAQFAFGLLQKVNTAENKCSTT